MVLNDLLDADLLLRNSLAFFHRRSRHAPTFSVIVARPSHLLLLTNLWHRLSIFAPVCLVRLLNSTLPTSISVHKFLARITLAKYWS